MERGKGKGSPSIETLESLLKPCGVSLAEFFNDSAAAQAQNPQERDAYEKLSLILKDEDDAVFASKLLGMVFDACIRNRENEEKPKKESGTVLRGNFRKEKGGDSVVRYLNSDAPRPAVYARVRYFDRIPASPPTQVEPEYAMWIDIIHSKVKDSQYVLKVDGNSMESPDPKEVSLRDGDLILLEHDRDPVNGDIVAALIKGHESTLKAFFREGKNIRFQPLNPEFEDIVVPAEHVTIQGVFVEVVRHRALTKVKKRNSKK